MPPVNAESIDWNMVRTEAPVVVVESPCDLYDALEAAVAALAGAVTAEALKDLSSLVEAMRAGRLVDQLRALQANYGEAVAPFCTLVADLKAGKMSGFSFIINFVFALLGLAGRAPSLLAHLPFLAITAPFRWCAGQYHEWMTARQLAEQQTRREELVAVAIELQQRDAAVKQEADKAGGQDTKYFLRSSWADMSKVRYD